MTIRRTLETVLLTVFFTAGLAPICYKLGVDSVKENEKLKPTYNIPRIDESVVDFFREKVTDETVRELSDLVLSHPLERAEGGGELWFDNTQHNTPNRFRFYEVPNSNESRIRELASLDKYPSQAIEILRGTLTSFLPNYLSSSSDCVIGISDPYWKKRIVEAKNAVDLADVDEEAFNRSVLELSSVLKDSYSKERLEGSPEGKFVADVHTHSNGTSFSNQDLCTSRSVPQVVVSYEGNNPRTFNLFLAVKEQSVPIGEYEVR